MIRNKKVLRGLALFFAANILFNVLLPLLNIGLSKALAKTQEVQHGVTPPNIVDLKSGDMNYSVPLISLPGGHSFDLSYHAGITPMENASWIGLGWSMEAGEISRSVNGYPDDYDGNMASESYTFASNTPKTYNAFGCLNGSKMTGLTAGSAIPGTYSFDTYVSHFPDNGATVIGKEDNYYGGSFPNYDGYYVSGGGMSGNIQPLILENPTLYHASNDSRLETRSSIAHKLFTQSKPCFRFVNDFSNSYSASSIASFTSPSNFGTANDATINLSNGLGYTYTANTDGFRASDMRLAGSKHVEYYTNAEIVDATSNGAKSKGFIGYAGMPNSGRNSVTVAGTTYNNLQNQVGGYSITDAHGNTYHYALPVYAYQRNSSTTNSNSIQTTIVINQPYAYKWLLTSITSTDYVDKNLDGYANEGDWGNWTSFVYGKWTDQFNERSPLTGNYTSQDGTSYNTLKKEVYYLDAAYTRTHAVLFPKSSRSDANGAIIGGSSAGTSLKLNSGLLFTADGIKKIRALINSTVSTLYDDITTIKGYGSGTVLEANDLQSIPSYSYNTYVAPLIVQESKLTQGYSLCPKSPNSTTTNNPDQGKLTLNSVSYYGRNGSQSTPNYDFTYELPSPQSRSIYITAVPGATRAGKIYLSGTTASQFQQGDIIKFTISSVVYYATIASAILTDVNSPSNPYYFDAIFLGSSSSIPGASQKNITVTATQTKNPPYTEGYYDIWGNFKSDYDYPSFENSLRKTSPVSAAGVDVWSLRKISTPTGALIEVEYESDTYSDRASDLGSRVLNVYPNIGFKPVQNQTNYTLNNGWYYNPSSYGNTFFSMDDLDKSLIKHEFKLYLVEHDAATALQYNVEVGQSILMSSLCYLPHPCSGGALSKQAFVTVKTKGTDAGGTFVTVEVGRNDLSGGLPFVDNSVSASCSLFVSPNWVTASGSFSECKHVNSYIIVGSKNMLCYGGGIRVKNVSLKGGGETFNTTYGYNNNSTGNTSGSIPFDPVGYNVIGGPFNYHYTLSGNDIDHSVNYKSGYASLLNFFESIRYFCPAPKVAYEFITVKNYGNTIQENTYREYHYEIFRTSQVTRQVNVTQQYHSNDLTTHRYAVNVSFKDLSSQAGNLLGVNTFDLEGNLVSRQKFNYSNETTIPLQQGQKQGVVSQVFHEHRKGEFDYVNIYGSGGTYAAGPPTRSCQTVWAYDLPLSEDPKLNRPFPIELCMWVPTATYLPYPQSKVGVSGNYEFFVVSSFDRYPTVLLSTETTDYLKGTSDKVEYKAYDFYNGSATEIITKDSYGNVFKNKVTPAYRQSSYAGMGLKMNGYSNMLSQTFKNEVFKVSPSNYNTDLGLMSSKVMTWTDNMNYRVYNSGTAYAETAVTENTSTLQKEKFYRPSAAYVWNSPLLNNDGSYSSSFVDFDPSSIHANWKKTTEQTLSNPWSVPLSSKDLNGNYSSQRLTKKKSLVHSQAANANHSSYTYASFEDFDEDYSFMEGELTRGYSPSSGVYYARTAFSAPHTGKYVAQVISGYPVSFNTLICPSCSDQVGKQYRASVWIHESSASGAALTMTVNGTVYTGAPPPAPSTTSATASTSAGITQAIAKSGQWYLVNVQFVIPANFIGTSGVSVSLSSSNGTAYFDDFRFHPIDSDVQGYVYDETTWQPTHVLDKDNFYTRYEYDNSGRLKTIYRETVNGEMKIEDRKYNVVKP